jgi:hypothetical protein
MPVRTYRGFRDYDLAGLMAMKGYGDWLSDIGSFVVDVIPAHTVVGKALRGDVGGAAKDAMKLISPPRAPPPPPTATPQGGFQAGGLGAMPSWALPAAIGALALVLLMKKR